MKSSEGWRKYLVGVGIAVVFLAGVAVGFLLRGGVDSCPYARQAEAPPSSSETQAEPTKTETMQSAAVYPAVIEKVNGWGHFRGDVQNTGATTQVAQIPLRVRWTKSLGTMGGQVIALDGKLYASARSDVESSVSSFDLLSGGMYWTVPVSGTTIMPHLATDGIRLYVNSERRLAALDPGSGALIWESTEAGSGHNPISVAGGIVFTDLAGGEGLIAVDAQTGMTLWTNMLSGYNKSAAAIVGGMLFIGSGYSSGHWYAVDAATGSVVWKYPVHTYISTSPSVVGGVMYGLAENGVVLALDAASGSLLWETFIGGARYSSPAVDGGAVYATTEGTGKVVKLDASSGEILWTATLAGQGWGIGNTVADGHVFTVDNAGVIYAINESNGNIDWSMTLPGGLIGGGNISREAVPVNGCIAIADDSGTLTVLENAAAADQWEEIFK